MGGALILATRNAHKVREVARLAGGAVELEPLPEEAPTPEETGTTYAENALIKARSAVRATGRPAIADDSGIEAEALDGRPGVRSARFAGPSATDAENLAKLVAEAPPGSGLRYVCVVAYVAPDGTERLFEGSCAGRMAERPRGAGGFGYDPVFVPDGEARTMAELDAAEKDAISHRGEAVRRLVAWLKG
jgi:XTP/dITP diphosphohydrolase